MASSRRETEARAASDVMLNRGLIGTIKPEKNLPSAFTGD
jgi:hypothetical protein